MLPENILEEITRWSALDEVFVRRLWPDISFESKLQIVSTITSSSSTPEWLMELCLSEKNEFLKYFVARKYTLRRDRPLRPGTPEDQKNERVTEALRQDPRVLLQSLFVPGSDGLIGYDRFQNFMEITQLSRILVIRNIEKDRVGLCDAFIDWVKDASKGKVSEFDLCRLVYEFFTHAPIKKRLLDYTHGDYSLSRLSQAWEFAKTAPRDLGMVLAVHLPTRIDVSELSNLPDHLLGTVLYRHHEPAARYDVESLIRHLEKSPSCSESIQEDLKFIKESKENKEPKWRQDEHRLREAADNAARSKVILEMLFALTQKVASITDDIETLKTKKSSWL